MSHRTKIEWCDSTWNPITGCSYVSIGCENCYARRMAKRLRGRFGYKENGSFDVTFHRDRLNEPLKWKKPRRIFVVSMGDLFHKDVQVDWIDSIYGIIEQCKQHKFLILTKRPENIEEKLLTYYQSGHRRLFTSELPKNLWLGVTVEHPDYLWRVDQLLKIPAKVRFVSVEPMLNSIDVLPYLENITLIKSDGGKDYVGTMKTVRGLDWIICGAETGPGARPFNLDWARDLRNQCRFAGIPFFFKSAGSQDISKDLDIREFPDI